MPGLLYIKTFGCQMNEYDSGKMRDVLEAAHGMTRTDNPAEADVLLVNTCSVREKAQEKVFSLLGEWRLFKQQRPHVVIGVGGCVFSQQGGGIAAQPPFLTPTRKPTIGLSARSDSSRMRAAAASVRRMT